MSETLPEKSSNLEWWKFWTNCGFESLKIGLIFFAIWAGRSALDDARAARNDHREWNG